MPGGCRPRKHRGPQRAEPFVLTRPQARVILHYASETPPLGGRDAMIDKLRVRNFRCLRDVEVPLGPLNFLIGPNNTGKSSLLDALELLSRCVHAAGTVNALAESGNRFERMVTGGDVDAQVTLDSHITCFDGNTHVQEASYSLAIGRGIDHPEVADESLAICEPGGGRRDHEKLPMLKGRSSFWQLRRQEGHEPYDIVAQALLCSPKYSLIPERMAEPCQIEPSSRLAADGHGLASCLDLLGEDDPRRFQEIEDALKRFVDSVQMVRFPAAAPGKKTILFHEKRTGHKVYASEASQGLLVFLAYLTIAYSHGDASMLLI